MKIERFGLGDLFQRYINLYPEEKKLYQSFKNIISIINPNEEFFPDNIVHICAGGFVINSEHEVLLLRHSRIDILVHVGGHLEPNDLGVLGAALREINEETEISLDNLQIQLYEDDPDIPLHIERYFHQNKSRTPIFDFQYLFYYPDVNIDIKIDPNESKEFRWLKWSEFEQIPYFNTQAKKISRILGL